MRSFIKYLSYSLVYLVFMVASAYGAITISMNNSANQQSILPGGGASSTTELPKQITSIVENLTSSNAIELDLKANIDSQAEDYVITLNTTVDLSKGFENISAQGVLKAEIIPAITTFSENSNIDEYTINFVYQNGKAFLDMFNGKISVDTNNILEPVMQILEILNIEMPDMGAMDLASMEINDMLSLLSDLTETKNEDGTINLDINIQMIGMSITLICDENYNIKEVVLPELELEGMKITTDLDLSYPENVEFEEKNEEEYIESSNLLNVVNAIINHFNTDAVAFDFDVNYQNSTFNGKAYANINDVSGKITLDLEGNKIDVIIVNETIYLEYQNVFVKFAFEDIEKVNTLLKENFNIELPIEAIKNGDFSAISGEMTNINPQDIDLSMVQKVYVDGDKTVIVIKEIGEIGVILQENSLKSISFNGFGVEANLEAIEYLPFELKQPTENYIDLSDLLPTIDNAISIFQSKSINGVVTLSKGDISLPINFIVNNGNDLFVEVWTEIKGNVIKLNYIDNKIYLDCAGKFKTLIEMENLADEIIDFLTGLDVTINTEGLEEMAGLFNDVLNVGINPLLIKELTQTADGFIVTLFNDLTLNLANGEKSLNISTNIEELDVNIQINGSNMEVVIPTFNDSEYNTMESIFDLTKAFINSGMLNVSIGAMNYFQEGTIGLDFNVQYQDNNFTGKLYADVANMKVELNVNYQGENLNFFVIDNVVYVEYRNIYLQLAFEDLGEIDNLLTTYFNIDLPFEVVGTLLEIAQSESVEDAMNKISAILGDSMDDFVVDLSVIDLNFFKNIKVKGNDTIISIGENVVTVTIVDEMLTKVSFSGLVEASADFVSYQNNQLTVDKENYVNLIEFMPTIENAIQIAQAKTINGTITVENQPIYFTKSGEYAEIWTEYNGYKISMQYLDGKAYLNFADKFKLMSVVENLPTAIEEFVNEINLEFGEIDSEKINETLSAIINPNLYPFLIKGLTQTENGFILTLFNDIVIELTNGNKTINACTNVQGYSFNVEIIGSEAVVTIPTINDEEYNTVENLLDIVKGFVNSGLLDVSMGALNYFKDLTLGLKFDVEYQGNIINGELNVDIENMKVNLSINYQGEKITFFIIDQIVYIEYRNIYLKFAFEDLAQIDNLLTTYFDIDLPFEMVATLLKIAESESVEEAIDEITNILGDFVLDLSVIDIEFFNKISVDGNNTIINLGENIVTVSVVDEILTNISFSGIVKANAEFVSYINNNIAIEETSFVDLADFLPTVENAIEVAQSNTINGTITVENQDIYFTISKAGELYAEIWTEIEGYKISMQYLNGKLYLNAADKFKLMSVVENLPNAIESFLNELNLEFGETDTSEITNTLMDIVDISVNPLLIKELNQTTDGFILILFNDISIALVNGSKTINVSTIVEGYEIDIAINGNNSVVNIPTINDEEYNTVENLLDIVKGFVNSGLLDVSMSALNYFKDLTLGLELNVNYQGYAFEGTIYLDLQAKKLYINALYDGHTIKVAVMNEIFYIELGNVLMKYSASNIGKIDEIANTYFGVDLPLEIVDDLLVITRCTTLEEVMTEIQNIFDIEGVAEESKPIDLSVIDINFLNNITTEGNNTVIPVGDNVITVTVENEILTNIAFSGLLEANAKFIPYADYTVNINDGDYIDLADLIPTVENAITIVQSETISGKLTIVDGSQTYPIDFVISKDGEYAEFKTVVYQANLSVQYYAGKVYICFADSINLISEIENLPDAINKLTEGTGSETNISIEEQNVYINMLYDVINPDKNPLLFTGFTQTANGYILSIFNGVNVTVNNSTNRIDISTAVNGITIDGYITGSDSVVTVPAFNDSLYIPIENIFNFVGAIKNMSKETDFHISGNMNIDGNLIGIGINWVVPFDIYIKIVDGKLEAMASIGPIPTMVGVNNDVPYKADDTNSGKDRILKVYIKDNDIYMHRREEVGQFFGGGRIYEKCTKISVDSFFADPMYYMQYALGFTDSIMGAIDEAIQKSANRSAPINLNNIIKGFVVDSTGNNLTIALNMAEIANNELLDVLTLNIALGKNSAGEDIISNVGLSIYMPLAEGVFTLTLTSNDIHFVNYGSPVDMTELYNYVNNYKYKYDEEWEASNGDWVKASAVLYTIIFEENGGNEIANISQIHSSPITLPTPSAIITDNGTYQSTKTFAGWYTTSTFDEGTLFTSTTMPRKDTTLYAKWTEEIRYYRTISFVTNSTDTLNNVVALEGNNITLPSLGIKTESDGITTIYYTFDGWYYDSALTNAFTNYIMPSVDTTLYAKWLVADVETARLLQVYDNNDVIFTRYILADETIDLSGVAKYIAGSTQLYYDAGYATIYDGSFIMPDSDLILYVRNKYTYILTTNQTGSVVEISRGTYWQNEPIYVPTPENYYTDDGTQTSRVYYTFTGYTLNGITGNAPSVMTNYDLTLCQTWSNETKFYYSVDFDLRWYLVFGCTEGSEMKDKPAPLDTVKVLDGQTLNLTPYQPTCTAYKTAVKTFFGKDQAKPFKATTWGTSPWDNYSYSGKGVNSIVVTGNITLYACWEEQ